MENILEMIKVKEGYKQTSIGIIPDGWDVKNLGKLSLIKGEYGINASAVNFEEKLPAYIRITDIDDDGRFNADKKKSVDDINSYKFYLEKDDLVFIRTGASVGKTYLYNKNDGNLVFAGFLIRFRINEKIANAYYIWSFTKSKVYWDWVKTVSTRSGQPGINSVEYSNLQIPLPPLLEQQKIAEILSIWDEAIENLKKVIEKTKKRNKGLAQQLLAGKKRLEGFEGKWKTLKISNVTDRVKKSFIPETEVMYQQIGIRSHTKGIFHKELVSGKSLGNKSVFWIDPDCFIVNIVFAWEHAIAKTTERELGMIASHRFPMFKPKKEILDLDYMLNYFKSPKGKDLLGLASPGGAGRNKTLGQSEFLKLQMPIPPLDEQIAISEVIKIAEEELSITEQKLITLQEQKKGLMQKLLTGEIRVKL
jgi:restriction endonuclease S subunit